MTSTKEPKPDDRVTVRVKPATYQPGKAEKEEEVNMPGLSLDQVRATLLRPVKTVEPD